MKLTNKRIRKGFTLVELLVVIAIIVALAAMATPAIFKALKRAAMAENVSNARQVKMFMEIFASDNDGVYPSEDSADFYEIAASTTSNDLFKQLFASGSTNSEKIFWVKGSKLCDPKIADDVFSLNGVFNESRCLEPGENGWAMVEDQTNTDNPARPLIFDSPPTGTGRIFDGELWDMKVVVVSIDGSARTRNLNPNFELLDGDNKELLTTASEIWGNSVTEIDIAYPLAPSGN